MPGVGCLAHFEDKKYNYLNSPNLKKKLANQRNAVVPNVSKADKESVLGDDFRLSWLWKYPHICSKNIYIFLVGDFLLLLFKVVIVWRVFRLTKLYF